MRILVVEDEAILAEAVLETLIEERYAADHAATGESASELMAVNDYDLVILDWTIPAPTGIELLREWRQAGKSTPVLMVTGHDDPQSVVSGLDGGADDYLTKPFAFSELLARVRSLLRRRDKPLQSRLHAGDLEMDRAARRVTVGEETIELAPKEFALLEYLLSRVGEVVSRSELVEHVWDESFDSFSNVVDVTVFRLRSKIDRGRGGELLQTVKGAGYRLRHERAG